MNIMHQDFSVPPFQGDIPSPSNTTGDAFFEKPGAPSEEQPPVVELAFQHLMDCSIECPTPFVLLEQDGSETETRVSVDVNTAGEGDSFQVILSVRVEIVKDEKPAHIIELKYAGYFIFKHVTEDMHLFVLYVHCPNLLWPSIRHWVRVVTLECGLPALQLANVDFLALLRHKAEESQKSDS
jgi:preprotein translocase subunit SecB